MGSIFASGDGTAVCSCFESGHIAFRQETHLIERDDPAVVGRRRWETHHELLDKQVAWRVDDPHRLNDLSKPRSDGNTIKWYWLAGMPRKHECVCGEREQLVQAVIEGGSACSRLLFIGLQVRTSDACREERITREQEMPVEQVAGAF